MSQKFIPAPYVDISEMRRRSYSHLFPRPGSDDELRNFVKQAIDLAKSKVDDRPEPQLGNGLTFLDDLKSNFGKNVIAALNRQTPQAAVNRLEQISEAVNKDEFDEASHFPNWRGESWLPSPLMDFFQAREDHYLSFSQDALYSGVLQAFWSPPTDDVKAFPNRFIWQDQYLATRALLEGLVSPHFGQPNGDEFEVQILFHPDNLTEVFPPYCPPSASVPGTHTKSRQIDRIVVALKELKLEKIGGDGYYGEIKQAKNAVIDHLNEKISDEQFRLARKQASEKG